MDDLIIIFCLIAINGIFSMAEAALISARKSKLSADARHGSRKAAIALQLSGQPDRFLSTIQIGITLIGILTGLFSGAALADDVATLLSGTGLQPNTAHNIAKIIIVAAVTYLSIVVGELVPKRIGIGRAETIAKAVAAPMKLLSSIVYPLVWLLSVSTSALTRLLHLADNEAKVTEEEIKSLIKEGADAGEVKEVEQDIMERALVLEDCRIDSIMTSRKDVISLKVGMDSDTVRSILSENLHSTYPVFNDDKESVCGIVSLKQLILMLGQEQFFIGKELSPGLFLPESMTVYDALDTFKRTREHSALICDEYGCFQGIVTLRDILDGLIGETVSDGSAPMLIKRPDKDEWLVDGQCPIYDFLSYFDRGDLYSPATYSTIGGLLLENLRRIPSEGDTVAWQCFNIEVIDMDHTRIDKLAVSLIPQGQQKG